MELVTQSTIPPRSNFHAPLAPLGTCAMPRNWARGWGGNVLSRRFAVEFISFPSAFD